MVVVGSFNNGYKNDIGNNFICSTIFYSSHTNKLLAVVNKQRSEQITLKCGHQSLYFKLLTTIHIIQFINSVKTLSNINPLTRLFVWNLSI